MALTVKNYELPNFGNFNGAQARLVGLASLPEIDSSKPWTLSKISFFANKRDQLAFSQIGETNGLFRK